MKIWHIFFFFSIVVVVMTAVPAVRTYVLAKQSGILAVKPAHAPGWLPRQLVSLFAGSAVFLGIGLQMMENNLFAIDSMETFQKILTENRMFLGAAFCAVLACHLSGAAKRFGFLTADGWYRFTADKPVKLTAQEREGKILFHPVADGRTETDLKPLLVFEGTEQNRETFAVYLQNQNT